MNRTDRLSGIALRQRKSFLRDAAFTVAVALAALVGAYSVATAADAAGTSMIQIAR